MKENLGKLGRDQVTGFEGIIVAWTQHLTGCDSYSLRPRAVNGNELKDGAVFDVGRVDIVGEGVSAKAVQGDKPGAEDLSKFANGN